MRLPLLLLVLALSAQVAQAGSIAAAGAAIPLPPPGAPTAAGYVTLTNHGRAVDRLTGGSTAAATSVEVHSMSTTGGVMRMRPIPGGLPIAPGASVTLGPGGAHLMLFGLRAPLRVGQHVKVTLTFAHAGQVQVDFPVVAAQPANSMADMHM